MEDRSAVVRDEEGRKHLQVLELVVSSVVIAYVILPEDYYQDYHK